MPTVNVSENIKKIIEAINGLTAEVYRLEGSLRVFKEFESKGLKEVDLPDTLPEDDAIVLKNPDVVESSSM
ncbi:hypothetical protein DSLPV1_050 [Dishui lake phycodnavirus 1]|uniref:hypothetical protein n=1 Tax=Dishui lake phycodnavirus 1 TaxID=2079134 RepID=UPI000CD683A3|nr:hypothetical protein C5Y57_gp050 [Dishui lake phycodnavirus 1]AUT19021.1 hypothetical protein DSLPV1_050 [Dishui lake phycodnavirus 1]